VSIGFSVIVPVKCSDVDAEHLVARNHAIFPNDKSSFIVARFRLKLH
jgi:hypothetical protein